MKAAAIIRHLNHLTQSSRSCTFNIQHRINCTSRPVRRTRSVTSCINPTTMELLVSDSPEQRVAKTSFSDNLRPVNETGNGDADSVDNGVSAGTWNNVSTLTCESVGEGGKCNVFLIGTAHVSKDSCREVKAVVGSLKPEVVFLELCKSRMHILTQHDFKVPTWKDVMEEWRKRHNLLGVLYGWFLAKIAGKLEVLPGSEFRVAVEEANKYGGKVILGDRPVQVTLLRTWRKMPFRQKAKFLGAVCVQALFLPDTASLNNMIKELDDADKVSLLVQKKGEQFPSLVETLVHERDRYMAHKLHKVASKHACVVAVVGKGHVNGIKQYWQKPIKLEELLEIPQKTPFVDVKTLTSLGCAAVAIAVLLRFYGYTK